VIPGDLPIEATAGNGARATLDDLFRRTVLRRPQALALADAPNRESFTEGAPRRLTYAEADRVVSAIAVRLRQMGLQTDTVVAFQLPNTVDAVLALLGILRAGMIAAPLPLLWRRAEAVGALSRIGAKVLVTAGRVGTVDHCELAMQIAAELFPIRYVAAFGNGLGDGVVPLEDVFKADALHPAPAVERLGNPAAHLAVITWDATADGLVPVARSHTQLIFGGLAVLLESGLPQDAVILSAVPGASFAGLSSALLPWLLLGGTLSLHGPFDAAAFAAQCAQEQCSAAVLPGPVAVTLAETGLLRNIDRLQSIVALWRSPERLLGSAASHGTGTNLIDVQVFGEVAVVAARRALNGRPVPIWSGPIVAPRGLPGAVTVGEITRTELGTIAFRGPMVAPTSFPAGADRDGLPHLKAIDGGFVDTGYTCRLDTDGKSLIVTGPPAGVVNLGAYRFSWRALQDAVVQADPSATIDALPDALTGHRLLGSAADPAAARTRLTSRGHSPLVADAFREARGEHKASAA
jgi:hypothetical protein